MTTQNILANKPVATPVKKALKPGLNKPTTTPAVAAVPKAVAKSGKKPTTKPAVEAAAVKDVKAKKPKMVRDSFTFPKDEYSVLDALKLRAAKLGSPIKKTELLRCGVKAIAALSDAAFLAALQAVPSLKTGRPAKGN